MSEAFQYIPPSPKVSQPQTLEQPFINMAGNALSGVRSVGDAMVQGWQNAPTFLTPYGQAQVDKYSPYIGGPITHTLNGLTAGVNAIYRGGQEQLVQLANGIVVPALQKIPGIENVLTPAALGRDLASVPDAFAGSPNQFSGYPTSTRPLVGAPVKAAPEAAVGFEHPRDYYSAPEPVTAPAVTEGAATVPSESTVGAKATPSEDAAMTNSQMKAARYQAESDQILEMRKRSTEPSVDTTPYVEGYQPTKAEWSGDPNVAVQQRVDLANGDGLARKTILDTNNADALQNHFDQVAGSPVQKETMEAARDAQAKVDTQQAFTNKASVDVEKPAPGSDTAIVPRINEILDGPDGKTPAVEKALNTVLDKLKDRKGDFETDPAQIYGVRDMVNKMLSKAYRVENPTSIDAEPHLMEIKKLLDDKIEEGAPGYNVFRQNYAQASVPIDAMNYLQDARAGLFRGGLNFGKYETFMTNLAKARNRDGFHISQSISPDQMNGLTDLGFNLARKARENAMGRVAGSNTFQNSVAAGGLPVKNVAEHMGGALAGLAAHGAVNTAGEMIAPGLGYQANALLTMGQMARSANKAQRAAKAQVMAKEAAEAAAAKAKEDRINSYFEPPPGIGHNGGPPMEP